MIVFVKAIQQAAAGEYSVPLSVMVEPDAFGTRIRDSHAHPRQSAIYVASCLTTQSYANLGRLFGHRDHTTILSAIASVKRRIGKGDIVTQGRVRRIAREVLS
jgi:chromosomal replication initiator protein